MRNRIVSRSLLLLTVIINLLATPQGRSDERSDGPCLLLTGETNAAGAFVDAAVSVCEVSDEDDAVPTVSTVYQTGIAKIGGAAMNFSTAGAANIVNTNADFNRAYTAFSVSFWYRPNKDSDANSYNNYLIGKMGDAANRGWQILRKDDQGVIQLNYNKDAAGTASDNFSADMGVNSNDFIHVAVTFVAGEFIRMYSNGVEVASKTTGILTSLNGSNNVPLQIGNRGDNSNESVDGILDDVGIWSESLSPDRVAAIHAMGKFEDLSATDARVNSLIIAFWAKKNVMINGHKWAYTTTGLSGGLGETGGSVSNKNAYVIMDTNNCGMQMVSSGPLVHLPGTTVGGGANLAFADMIGNNHALPSNSLNGDTGEDVGGIAEVTNIVSFAVGDSAMSFPIVSNKAANIAATNAAVNRTYTNFTVSLWYKPNHDMDSNPNFLIGKSGKTSKFGWHLRRLPNSSSVTFVYYSNTTGNAQTLTGAAGVSTTAFTHIVVTYDAAGNALRIYSNGREVSSLTSGNFSKLNGSNSVPLQIGNRGDNSIDSADGIIDDVGIWDRTLSAQEIAAMHAMGSLYQLNLQSVEIDQLLQAFAAQTNGVILDRLWTYTTGLSGPAGIIGGCIANDDVSVVLDSNGNGMKMVQPVFKGAMGFGIQTAAGFDPNNNTNISRIIYVTNLNKSGAGSFSNAIAGAGPRIVVFNVGGVIDLGGKSWEVANPYITIAGQTAPYPGITLIKGGLKIKTHDVLIQHIRIRVGDGALCADDAITTSSDFTDANPTNDVYNVVVDHCTFSWGTDETASISGNRGGLGDICNQNVTYSYNIIAETMNSSPGGETNHSRAMSINDNCRNIAIVRNIFAHNDRRHPLYGMASSGVFMNNLIYDFGTAVAHQTGNPDKVSVDTDPGRWSFIGNDVIPGESIDTNGTEYAGQTLKFEAVIYGQEVNGLRSAELYVDNNRFATNESCPVVFPLLKYGVVLLNEPPVWTRVDVLNVTNVQSTLMSTNGGAGAWPAYRDYHDSRIIEEISTLSGQIIDEVSEVGGYPEIQGVTSNFTIPGEWTTNFRGYLEFLSAVVEGCTNATPRGWPPPQ